MTSRLWRESHLGLNGTKETNAVIPVHCKILLALGERLHHTRDAFQATSSATFQRRSYQRGGIGACPLWDTEDAAHAVAHACGAACSQQRHGSPLRRGSAAAATCLTRWGTRACRNYCAAPPRDNCLFLSSLASILAATTLLLAMIRRRSITSAGQTASLAAASPLTSPALSSDLRPPPSLVLSLSAFGRLLVSRP